MKALLKGGVDSIKFCDVILGLLWFLPAYSPDMNPFEGVFSQVKQSLKDNAAA